MSQKCWVMFGVLLMSTAAMLVVDLVYFNHQSLPSDEQVLSQDYVTYELRPGCTVANNTAFLQKYINFTPYRDGCGTWGDGVSSYEDQNAEDPSALSLQWKITDSMMLGGLFIAPIVFVVISIIVLYCGLRETVEQSAAPFHTYFYHCCTGILVVNALILAITTTSVIVPGSMPNTWICRPYVATPNSFGDLPNLNIVSEDEWRGSANFNTLSEWQTLLDITAYDCPGVVLQPTPPNRSFQIKFVPGPDVAAFLYKIKSRMAYSAFGNLLICIILFCVALCQTYNCPCRCQSPFKWPETVKPRDCCCGCDMRCCWCCCDHENNNTPLQQHKEVIINESTNLVVGSAPPLMSVKVDKDA